VTEPTKDPRPPRGALIVIAIGLIACVAAALLTTDKGSGTAAQLEWVQETQMASSKAVSVPGGHGEKMALTEGGIRATGTNVSGYELFRSSAILKIEAGAPVGGARILCTVQAPGGTEVAQTPGSRASYPRSSEELLEQPVPEVVLVEFSSHGTELAVVEFEDLPHSFATEKGIKVKWPAYQVGREQWEWFLPSGPPAKTLELPFATVWRTTKLPAAQVTCTLTTSAGKSTVRGHGALTKKSEPIAE
jgi:hypothetical protein